MSLEGEKIIFAKIIDSNNTKFYYNGISCKFEEYQKQLELRNIHSKLLYFILTQGAVDSFFTKKMSLANIIDILSGSAKLKEEYEEAEEGWKKAKADLVSQGAKVREIKAQKNQKKEKINGGEELKELKENNVVLEFQITSNVRLNNLTDLENIYPSFCFIASSITSLESVFL